MLQEFDVYLAATLNIVNGHFLAASSRTVLHVHCWIANRVCSKQGANGWTCGYTMSNYIVYCRILSSFYCTVYILYDYIVFYNLQYDFSLPMHLYIGYSADSKSYEWSFHFRNITLSAEDLNATLFAMEGVTEAQKDVLRAKPNQICTWNPKANHLNNCCFNWDGLKSLLINRHPLNLGFQVSHIFYVKSSKLDHRFLLSLKWCGYTETAAMSPWNTSNISFFGAGEPGNLGNPASSRIEFVLSHIVFTYLELGLMVQKGDWKNVTIGPFDLRAFSDPWGSFTVFRWPVVSRVMAGQLTPRPNIPPPK